MADELLPYYEKELAFIRQMGAEFAKEHPKIAGRLGISSDTIEDPHVSRLIEGFAYLNARIQHKLDDDFPELTDALLNIMFPHYQRPLPSMAIVQFTPDADQLDSRYRLNRGNLIDTEHFQGEFCRFKTCLDVDLLPIKVTHAEVIGRPFTTPGAAKMRNANSVLKISLETFAPEITFTSLDFKNLRFYLKGQSQHIHPLYRLLVSKNEGVVLSAPDQSSQPIYAGKDNVQQVGFLNEEALLPYPAASFIGYRLITEFFAYPEKFNFLDFCDFKEKLPHDTESKLDIYIYLSESDVELEHNIDRTTFALGCTPAINLFSQLADPIRIDHAHHEYQIIPDARRKKGFEVYAVDKVDASSPEGDVQRYLPFYGLKHNETDKQEHAYWYASRRNAKFSAEDRDDGTNVFLSLVDLEFNPNLPEDKTLSVSVTCCNRDQPAKLPFNLEHPKLQCVDAAPPCEKIRFITQPSATIRPPLRDQARWRLISHLSLNQLSITGTGDSLEAFKEILRLYNFTNSSVNNGLVESIHALNVRQISAPLTVDGRATMCRGIEIEVTLNPALLTGSNSFVFASILEHFFALYCSVNSFTRVLVKILNQEGYLKKCAPRAGEKVFL